MGIRNRRRLSVDQRRTLKLTNGKYTVDRNDSVRLAALAASAYREGRDKVGIMESPPHKRTTYCNLRARRGANTGLRLADALGIVALENDAVEERATTTWSIVTFGVLGGGYASRINPCKHTGPT